MARFSFASATKRIMPPWLQRSVGGRLMLALGGEIDTMVERARSSVALRFPGLDLVNLDTDERALSYTGRERRIRRGPSEAAATYAARLLPWWEEHQVRGGPYALLRQLHAYFLATLNVQIDLVYHDGTRRWIDEAGAITRDAITWNADGTDQWAQFWLFVHLPEAPLTVMTTLDGDTLVTIDGDSLITLGGVDLGLTGEAFRVVPREWNAAHILRITVVLLWPEAELWGYPQPVGTWAEDDPVPGQVWQAEDPVVMTVEE